MTAAIEKYFPELNSLQSNRFAMLWELYEYWNARINVISRRDMDSFYERHVLHSLAIARVCAFDAGARIMDVGTGGGFPGIPLAILFSEADFTLVDSIGKKITVVSEVVSALGLTNVKTINCRAETVEGIYDYVVSRAVTDIATFLGWIGKKIEKSQKGTLPNGTLCLKGGDITEELAKAKRNFDIFDIPDYFSEEFFATKKVIYAAV